MTSTGSHRPGWQATVAHDDCAVCDDAVDHAITMATVTGSVGATYTSNRAGADDAAGHRGTVVREPS
jgi:hypothetical protein